MLYAERIKTEFRNYYYKHYCPSRSKERRSRTPDAASDKRDSLSAFAQDVLDVDRSTADRYLNGSIRSLPLARLDSQLMAIGSSVKAVAPTPQETKLAVLSATAAAMLKARRLKSTRLILTNTDIARVDGILHHCPPPTSALQDATAWKEYVRSEESLRKVVESPHDQQSLSLGINAGVGLPDWIRHLIAADWQAAKMNRWLRWQLVVAAATLMQLDDAVADLSDSHREKATPNGFKRMKRRRPGGTYLAPLDVIETAGPDKLHAIAEEAMMMARTTNPEADPVSIANKIMGAVLHECRCIRNDDRSARPLAEFLPEIDLARIRQFVKRLTLGSAHLLNDDSSFENESSVIYSTAIAMEIPLDVLNDSFRWSLWASTIASLSVEVLVDSDISRNESGKAVSRGFWNPTPMMNLIGDWFVARRILPEGCVSIVDSVQDAIAFDEDRIFVGDKSPEAMKRIISEELETDFPDERMKSVINGFLSRHGDLTGDPELRRLIRRWIGGGW